MKTTTNNNSATRSLSFTEQISVSCEGILSREELQLIAQKLQSSELPQEQALAITVTSDVRQLEKALTLSNCLWDYNDGINRGHEETGYLLIGNAQFGKSSRWEVLDEAVGVMMPEEAPTQDPEFKPAEKTVFLIDRHEWNNLGKEATENNPGYDVQRYKLFIYTPA